MNNVLNSSYHFQFKLTERKGRGGRINLLNYFKSKLRLKGLYEWGEENISIYIISLNLLCF